MASEKSLGLTDLFYKKSETRTRQEITDEIQDSIENSPIIQGKVNKTDIVDNITSNDTDKPLSAKQGKVLKGLVDTKASTSELNNAVNDLDNRKVNVSDIKDNLTSSDINKPLSAKQGKTLKGLIDTKADTSTVNSEVSRLDGLIDNVESDIDDLETNLNTKVDKVTGKGLSTNDYTTAEKNKLNLIEAEANKTIVDSALNPLSTNPVQNKVICEEFYDKEDIVSLLNNIQTGSGKLLTIYVDEDTGDLVVDDDGFEYYTKTEADAKYPLSITKQVNPSAGILARYTFTQNGSALATVIDIPKDFLVREGRLVTVGATPSSLETQNHLTTGDKYILLVVNTSDNDGATNLVIPVTDLVDTYAADEVTLHLDANNVFSIREVPATLITGVLPANQVTHQDISGKVNVSDIKNNLTSTDTNKPLSAKQGKELKTLVDGKVNSADLATVATTGDYNDLTGKPSTMAPSAHTHNISDVSNLQSSLNSKMNTSDYSTVTLSVVFEDNTTGTYNLLYLPVGS